MTTVIDVANYFLQKDLQEDDVNSITNLKMQKLVYYAQGFHLALFGGPVFEEEINAWLHGPVVRELYDHCKDSGKSPLPWDYDINAYAKFNEEQQGLLDEVFSEFGQYTAWRLRDMTHEESPWLNHEKAGDIIPKSELLAYFKTRLL